MASLQSSPNSPGLNWFHVISIKTVAACWNWWHQGVQLSQANEDLLILQRLWSQRLDFLSYIFINNFLTLVLMYSVAVK